MSTDWKVITRKVVIHLHRIEPVSYRQARAIAKRLLKGQPIVKLEAED